MMVVRQLLPMLSPGGSTPTMLKQSISIASVRIIIAGKVQAWSLGLKKEKKKKLTWFSTGPA